MFFLLSVRPLNPRMDKYRIWLSNGFMRKRLKHQQFDIFFLSAQKKTLEKLKTYKLIFFSFKVKYMHTRYVYLIPESTEFRNVRIISLEACRNPKGLSNRESRLFCHVMFRNRRQGVQTFLLL